MRWGDRASRRAALLALLALLCACEGRGGGSREEPAAAPGDPCAEPREGCACPGNQPPVACTPEGVEEEGFCFEGTRYCRAGRFGGCEAVRRYAQSEAPQLSALIDDDATEHAPCGGCDRITCFGVKDEFDPAEGEIGEFGQGVAYHSSGAGLTLLASDSMTGPAERPPGLPDGVLYVPIHEGLRAGDDFTAHLRTPRSDVHLLLDQSTTMALETQALADNATSGALLPADAVCASDDPGDAVRGLAGALRCLSVEPELGLGVFRDVPFSPYAADATLAEPEREADARRELLYGNRADQSADLDALPDVFADLPGLESSGDPDRAGSQVLALHALVTGDGLFTGLGRPGVAAAAPCASGRFGYPCFRDGGEPIVVLVSDAAFHNGPNPGSYPYDYDPAQLEILGGTSAGALSAGGNDRWGSAFVAPDEAGASLSVIEGSTSGLDASVPAAALGCGAHELAPDALFRFDVDAAGAADITLGADDIGFAGMLAITDGPVVEVEDLPDADDLNEHVDAAYDLGDVAGRHLVVRGDTERPAAAGDMAADYQGALFGAACGANSLAPDAAFEFHVAGTSGPTPIDLTLDMGSDRGVLSVYEGGAGDLPRWPARTTPLVLAAEPNGYPGGDLFDLRIEPGREYATVTGNTSAFTSDFAAEVMGGSCSADDASNDAVLKLTVDQTRRLRIDTEGSSFDTVISLHDTPPPTKSGLPNPTIVDDDNENAGTAYPIGEITGLAQSFRGNTAGMTPDVPDTFGCGLDAQCGDAVYSFDVAQRTSVRLQVSSAAFTPSFAVTRAPPQAGATGRYSALALGESHTCALSNQRVFCWGRDQVGQLGNGGAAGDAESFAPVEVAGLTSVVQVASAVDHSCAVTAAGQVHCWGEGSAGQLGDGQTADRYAPVQVVGVSGTGALTDVVQVVTGVIHSCALRSSGSVVCWGGNIEGQLGDGTNTPHAVPAPVSGTVAFQQIAANDEQTCAIRADDHSVYCWGQGSSGEMGDNSFLDNTVPARTSNSFPASHVMVGEDHVCAVEENGRVRCWGAGGRGRLGLGAGDVANHDTPWQVRGYAGSGALGNVAGSFAAGAAHTCVTTLEGFVKCWGGNDLRQLGDGGTADRALPSGVHQLLDAVQVVAARNHTCALRANGAIACWGEGGSKLGSGSAVSPTAPVASQPGSAPAAVAFGSGTLDSAFTKACGPVAQPPEPGCRRRSFGGRSYFVCSGRPRTFGGAALACDAVGYELADIDTAGENAFLADEISALTFIGVKRDSGADYTDLANNFDFENLAGDPIFHTEELAYEECWGWLCTTQPARGWFHPAAAPDLVDSDPWYFASTFATSLEPNPAHGRNCIGLSTSAEWSTTPCSAIPSSAACGPSGLGCLVPEPSDLAGGPLAWVTPFVTDLHRLPNESLGGGFAAPHFAGGEEHDYACEERGERSVVLTLDPGRYYVTVKGADDGVTGACTGGVYTLSVSDLSTPSGGVLACSDDDVAETSASAIEAELAPGDYYLLVKGKQAADAGPFQLTVRDVDAVQTDELACDAGAGGGDPSTLTVMAEPGRSYYAVVKGEAPADKGGYTLHVRDRLGAGGQVLACDTGSGPGGAPQLTASLPSGTYYAVLKGRSAGAEGDYRLTLGGGDPVTATFTPPTYDATVSALDARGVRVLTVLSCDDESCDDAQAQAAELATDTGGALRVAAAPDAVPSEVIAGISLLEAFDSVSAELVFAPDENPGFVDPGVTALPAPSNLCAAMTGTGFSGCQPGATPAFAVALTNPALTPVPPAPGDGIYEFTLRVTAVRGGRQFVQDTLVLVAPSGPPPPDTFSSGSYYQDIEELGCTRLFERGTQLQPPQDAGADAATPQSVFGEKRSPSWEELVFNVDVRPETSVTFSACTAGKEEWLDECQFGGRTSGYRRVVTITAGDTAKSCTPETQETDCLFGFCSPYTGICNYLEGGACEQDADCPGTRDGRCHFGPSAATLGETCEVVDGVADPSSVLAEGNFFPLMRVKIDLTSSDDGARTPSVFSWEARYVCRSVK